MADVCRVAEGRADHCFSDELIYQPAMLMHYVNESNATILELVPSYLAVALDSLPGITLNKLELLLTTGEAVSKNLLEKWFSREEFSHIPVINAHTALRTEASDDICHYFMRSVPERANVPIGKPIQNTRIYILSEKAQLCPVGIPGEICVTGVGVSRGYLNQPVTYCGEVYRRPLRYGPV